MFLSALIVAFRNLFFAPVFYGVITSFALFSSTWENADRVRDQLDTMPGNQQDNFDFIIVGGGSSGSVLAYRLSEHFSVLLLEAGGEPHPLQAVPGFTFFTPNYPATDWSYKSVKQGETCGACVGQRHTFSQGKGLGGSSNLNYLIHLRGSPKDYDNWAEITKDDRWSFNQVLKDFKASERFLGATNNPDSLIHGFDGPLSFELPKEIGLGNEWIISGREMGYSHVDLNGNHEGGFDFLYYPTKRGIRQATYGAFIQPVRNRASLTIRKYSKVDKILIKANEAYGVHYERHGVSCFAYAKKEVILSAGTFGTAKLLMVSGIGPRKVLERCQVPVIADLPVGARLQDHVSTLLGPFTINSNKPVSFDTDVTPGNFLKLINEGTGPLTSSGFQATGLLSSSFAKAGWPDIQLTLFGVRPHHNFHSDLARSFGLREDVLEQFYRGQQGKASFFILVSLGRPESRGEVWLGEGRDSKKTLLIDPRYLSSSQDMEVMLEGINQALFLAENTTVFRNCGTKLSTKPFPGCESLPYRSPSYWECYIRKFTITLNDHVGTAPMGFEGSSDAVTDSELRVLGIGKLRVVDASVMPSIPSTNVQAATLMVAEKAAQFILSEWSGGNSGYGDNSDIGYLPPNQPSFSLPQPPVIDDSIDYLQPPAIEEKEGNENVGSEFENTPETLEFQEEDTTFTPKIDQDVPTPPTVTAREGKLFNFPDSQDENVIEDPFPPTTNVPFKTNPPKITVNPRGHFGYEREGRLLFRKTTPIPQTSTSVGPLPQAVVIRLKTPKYKRRRRKRRDLNGALKKPSSTETKFIIPISIANYT